MKRVEEGAGELVISRGDSAVDLQVTDHALDAVALAIHAPVPADAKRTRFAPLEPFSSWPFSDIGRARGQHVLVDTVAQRTVEIE
jgi:hypothetical protein